MRGLWVDDIGDGGVVVVASEERSDITSLYNNLMESVFRFQMVDKIICQQL